MGHVLLLASILVLLLALEKGFGSGLLVLKVDQLLEPKDEDIRRIARAQVIPEEVVIVFGMLQVTWLTGAGVPSQNHGADLAEGAILRIMRLHARI